MTPRHAQMMFAGMDSVGPDVAPVRKDTSAASFFFVAWVFTGSFFAMNLFVGVIVDNFNRISKQSEGTATMTAEQLQWVESMKALRRARPASTLRRPTGSGAVVRFRRRIFGLISHPYFDASIGAVIVANVGVMACDFWAIGQRAPRLLVAFNGANKVFLYVYYVECALKITAAGLSYFSDGWCRFDFFLVATALLDQLFEELLASLLPIPPMLLRILRSARRTSSNLDGPRGRLCEASSPSRAFVCERAGPLLAASAMRA